MNTRYKIGDEVSITGKYVDNGVLKTFLRGSGYIKEIRGNPRFNERRLYIVEMINRVRMCHASELKLLARKQ